MVEIFSKQQLSAAEYKEIFNKLHKLFPKLFNKNKILLMKKGIFTDLIKCESVEIQQDKLRKFFKIYTDKKAYQMLHLKVGESRYNLCGEVQGKVSKDEVYALRYQRKEKQQARFRRKIMQSEDFEYCYDNVTNIKKKFSKPRINQVKKRFSFKLGVKH